MARMIDADVASKRFRGWLEGPHGASEYNSGFDEAIYRVLDVIEHLPTLTPPNGWVSVEERLPKYNIREDGELVSSKILCYCETDKTVHLAVSQKFYIGRMGEIVHPICRYYDEWGYEVENVSHWMPLPAPPDRRPPEGEEEA